MVLLGIEKKINILFLNKKGREKMYLKNIEIIELNDKMFIYIFLFFF